MAGTTSQGFRFPTGGDVASDAAIATLVNDFDIEILNQGNVRAKLRYRPVGVMDSNAATTVSAGVLTKIKSEIILVNQGSVCDAANNRFTISATAGAGAYFVWGVTSYQSVSTASSVTFFLYKNGSTTYQAAQMRNYWGGRVHVGAIVNLVVGDNVGFYASFVGTGTMNFTQPRAYLYKLTD